MFLDFFLLKKNELFLKSNLNKYIQILMSINPCKSFLFICSILTFETIFIILSREISVVSHQMKIFYWQ